jgi:hypothetical protein
MKTTKSIWGTVPRKDTHYFSDRSFLYLQHDRVCQRHYRDGTPAYASVWVGHFTNWSILCVVCGYGNYSSEELVEGGIANLATQFFVMGLLGNWLPDLPAPTWMGAAEIARLQSRLTFGGIAIIFAVAVKEDI